VPRVGPRQGDRVARVRSGHAEPTSWTTWCAKKAQTASAALATHNATVNAGASPEISLRWQPVSPPAWFTTDKEPHAVPRTLLAVHAHPDDESSKGAGSLARYAAEGVRTVIVTCTGGEAGDILNPAMDQPGVRERMPELRRAELARALEILDVTAHYWLGYRDSGMPDTETNGHPDAFANASLDEAAGRLVAIIRAERPQVLVTYDESGGYPHPDHIRTHEVSVAAFDAAGDPGRHPDAGAPYQPLKLYYHASFTRSRLEAIHAGAVARGIDSPFAEWLERWDHEEHAEPRVTTQVDVRGFLARRRDALLAHATQIDPTSFWFAIPEEVVADVYPWEDYLLARSLVPVPEHETDLFEGIDQDGDPAG
jgi:mycothiol S-conjugate amidase